MWCRPAGEELDQKSAESALENVDALLGKLDQEAIEKEKGAVLEENEAAGMSTPQRMFLCSDGIQVIVISPGVGTDSVVAVLLLVVVLLLLVLVLCACACAQPWWPRPRQAVAVVLLTTLASVWTMICLTTMTLSMAVCLIAMGTEL